MNIVIAFCLASAVAADSQTGNASHVPDTGGSSRTVTTGLWQWPVDRHTAGVVRHFVVFVGNSVTVVRHVTCFKAT